MQVTEWENIGWEEDIRLGIEQKESSKIWIGFKCRRL